MTCMRTSNTLAVGVLLALIALPSVPASAMDSAEFQDWYVACDNGLSCSAFGFDLDDTGFAYLRLDRGAEPSATPLLSVHVPGGTDSRHHVYWSDAEGQPINDMPLHGRPGVYSDVVSVDLSTLIDVQTLISAAETADALIVRTEQGRPAVPNRFRLSLRGAGAAFDWMDKQQLRVGTPIALVEQGETPLTAEPPAVPVVHAARPWQPAPALPEISDEAMQLGNRLCDEDEIYGARVEPLSEGRVIHFFHCREASGARNARFAVWVSSPNDLAAGYEPGLLWPNGEADDSDLAQLLPNATFEARMLRLTYVELGAGWGDCGMAHEHVWDGQAFRLIALRYMEPCRGVPQDEWPVLFRAEVR